MSAGGVIHTPVMLQEVLEHLAVKAGGLYVDCTLGTGGHAAAMLQACSPGGKLLGIDADPGAIEAAGERLQPFAGSYVLVNDNFANLESICRDHDFGPVDGVLFDLGISSRQLADRERGFSFQWDAPLDMRFNPAQRLTAAMLVNSASEDELADLLRSYGEEPQSRRLARLIVQARPIHSALELANLVKSVSGRQGKIHPATRVFQALRIAVNGELESLQRALEQTGAVLGGGGRLVVISYHSLEDRLVKDFMRRESSGCICPVEAPVCTCGHVPTMRVLTSRIVKPSASEVARNPRARSARLRAAQRLGKDDV